jgi:beta-lactamase superfamily II metal-dependent hydrolase
LMADWLKGLATWKLVEGDVEGALAQLVTVKKYHADPNLNLGPDDLAPKLLAQLKKKDDSDANGSSIAFLAEFEGKSCLFLADAHMDLICDSLRRLGHTAENPLKVDAVKLSHHGSSKNLTQEFLALVDAEHYLVSTNGDQHGHPDKPAIEAVIVGSRRDPTIWFNYHVDSTREWDERSHQPGERFRACYPDEGAEGITITL